MKKGIVLQPAIKMTIEDDEIQLTQTYDDGYGPSEYTIYLNRAAARRMVAEIEAWLMEGRTKCLE